jgi:hypothetical protein
LVAFETEGCGSCVSNICAEVDPRLHGQLDLAAAPVRSAVTCMELNRRRRSSVPSLAGPVDI